MTTWQANWLIFSLLIILGERWKKRMSYDASKVKGLLRIACFFGGQFNLVDVPLGRLEDMGRFDFIIILL